MLAFPSLSHSTPLYYTLAGTSELFSQDHPCKNLASRIRALMNKKIKVCENGNVFLSMWKYSKVFFTTSATWVFRSMTFNKSSRS